MIVYIVTHYFMKFIIKFNVLNKIGFYIYYLIKEIYSLLLLP